MEDTIVSEFVVDICKQITTTRNKQYAVDLIKVDQFSLDVKYIQNHLKELGVPDFYYRWDCGSEDIGNGNIVKFDSTLYWDKHSSKVLYLFSEEDDPMPVLGETMRIRLSCVDKLRLFLQEGNKRLLN